MHKSKVRNTYWLKKNYYLLSSTYSCSLINVLFVLQWIRAGDQGQCLNVQFPRYSVYPCVLIYVYIKVISQKQCNEDLSRIVNWIMQCLETVPKSCLFITTEKTILCEMLLVFIQLHPFHYHHSTWWIKWNYRIGVQTMFVLVSIGMWTMVLVLRSYLQAYLSHVVTERKVFQLLYLNAMQFLLIMYANN